MKIFLSGIEGGDSIPVITKLLDEGVKLKYNLTSFYYITNSNFEYVKRVRDNSELILVDSGAHSFQKGKQVDWDKYTEDYAEFIRKFDAPNVLGYFEMDVDNIIGYDKVLELRKVLEKVTDKIIPVWHKNRGIDGFKKMCQEYSGKIVAITGFKNEDIKDEQYMLFLKYAKKYGCKVHCLGMTRKKILDTVPFDYVDSSSWIQHAIFGRIDGVKRKVSSKDYAHTNKKKVIRINYTKSMELQDHYYKKWRHICKD